MIERKTNGRFLSPLASPLFYLLFTVLLALFGCTEETRVLPVHEFRFTQEPVRNAALSDDARLAAFIFDDSSVSVLKFFFVVKTCLEPLLRKPNF